MAEIKIDGLKAFKSEEAKEPAAHEKAAEKLKQAARALSGDEGIPTDYQVLAGKYGEVCAKLKDAEQSIDILRTELKEKIRELMRTRKLIEQESADYKKTISKMQQTHEAELQDLKDQLGEAQAAAEAAKKAHAHAVGEKNNYADTLDNDSIAFEEIRALAVIMDRNAKSLQELAKMVRERTEV